MVSFTGKSRNIEAAHGFFLKKKLRPLAGVLNMFSVRLIRTGSALTV